MNILDEADLRPYEKDAFKFIRSTFKKSKLCEIKFPCGLGSNLITALTPYIIGAKKVLIIAPNELSAWKIYFDMWYVSGLLVWRFLNLAFLLAICKNELYMKAEGL